MAQTNINIRMDENLKRDFESVCAEIGLSMTAAFTVFAKAVSINKEIPFKLSVKQESLQTEEWGHLSKDYLFSVTETAGIAAKWADPSLISLENKSPWSEAAVANEKRKQKEIKKNVSPGH